MFIQQALTRKDHSHYWQRSSIRKIVDKQDQTEYYVIFSENIDKEKLWELELKKKNEFLNNVVNALNFPFIIIDGNTFEIAAVNNEAKQFLSDSQPSSKKCYGLIHKQLGVCNTDEFTCPIKEFKTNKSNSFSKNIPMEISGEKKYYEINCHPIYNAKGDLVQVMEYFIDITERVKNFKSIKQSKEFYEVLLNNIKEYIYSVETKDGAIINEFHSAKCLDVTGYSQEDYYLNPHLWYDMIHPDDRQMVSTSLEDQDVLDSHIPIKHRIIDKDGKVRWINNTSASWFNKTTGVSGKVGFITDITDKIENEDKTERFLRAIEESLASIAITDTKGVIEYVNPQFCEITGYTKDELIGSKPSALKSGLVSDDYYKNMWLTISSGKKWIGEFCNKKKSGELYWELVSINPVKNQQNEITHFLAIKEDITERRAKEFELIKAKEVAEDALKARGEFLANMSHEIRTPMNAIIGMSNLLLETDLSIEQKDYLETIGFSADILLNVINDILDFSKIEAGKLTLEESDFDLHKIIDNAIDLVYFTASKKDLAIYSNVSNEIPKIVQGDSLRIRQILLNLINNAIKFTEKGYIKIDVDYIESKNSLIKIKFSIEDTGIGISRVNIKKLFKPFSQADASMSRRFGGSGLGLIISKRLIDMMNGKIWVDSKLGVGSKFTFVITLKESQIDEKCPYCGKFTNSSIGLVVEDNILKEILNYYLEPTGCKQYIYSSIEEFNEASRTDNYDIVFIEDNLLDSSKNSEIDIVKKTKQEKNIKFVVITTRLYLNTKTGNIYKDLFDDNLSRTIKKSKLFTIIDKFIDMASRNDRRGQETSKTIETSQQVINKLHILVAEDNETNQKLLKIILTKLGHTFDIAVDGQEAIDMVSANKYDIILMDIQMPNLNGYEATSHLRKAGLTIPIIAVSANAFQEDVENSLNSGMNGHITKPYIKDEIEEILNYYSFKTHSPKQNVAKNSEDAKLFNYEELLENFENEKEIVKEVLELFIKKVENQIIVIEDASKHVDYEKIKFESHSIKGGSFNITAKKLGNIAEKIELAAKINNLNEIKNNISPLKEEFAKVKEAILKFL